MIKWILNKIVGSKNQRELRRLRPIVKKIRDIEESWSDCDQDFLINKTREWQQYLHRFTPLDLPSKGILQSASEEDLAAYAAKLNVRFESLRDIFPNLPTVEPSFESIEKGKHSFADIEPRFSRMRSTYLEIILPEAFAAVKSAARLMMNSEIDVCGTTMTWEMIHFDVQLLGGIALHRGFIAEMATGEGKTLVATLPVYLNALTGQGVHVVTVNDYLARRDSMWMGSLFKFLGLSIGCIQSMMPNDQRRQQYNCDITYGTNAEFGFDYLRDNGMATTRGAQVQRGHYFAIIDEVDSILIDEARTPLIISGPAPIEREHQYDELKPLIESVVKQQTDLCNKLMTEAEEEAKANNPEAAGRCLYKVKLGMPRNRAFLRSQQDPDFRRMLEKYELFLHQDPRKLELYKLKEELFFYIDEKTHDADLMEMGREVISPGNPEAFVLPDIGTEFVAIDENEETPEFRKEELKDELIQRLDSTGARLHTTSQLLKAYTLYEKDVEYVVREGKIIIIDQNTGREMPGRRWSDGLHQAVEAKENVDIEAENMTYATITIQNYFRLYERLAGMTGTAETEASEFHDIYKLDVLPIPTNRDCIRADKNDLIFKSRREKFNAVIAKINELHATGQPILIGTASVDASETLSRMLKRSGIVHEVLNAKNHQREAEIIAKAGQKGAVTVATNMAGRGTDIKLGAEVPSLGGLYVLGTERYESRRIDRQLRGRCSRQGDPGASQFFLSFEDDLMRNFGGSERMTRMMDRFGMDEGEAVENRLMNKVIEGAQKRVEQRNYMWRKHILDYDDVMNQQRSIVYGMRNNALLSEDPRDFLYEMLESSVSHKTELCLASDAGAAGREDLMHWLNTSFPMAWSEEELGLDNKDASDVSAYIIQQIKDSYEKKIENDRPDRVESNERSMILQAIDKLWQQHITDMDALREGVRLRAQGQKDPLVEYKSEAYNIFEALIVNIEHDAASGLMRSSAGSLGSFEDFLSGLPAKPSENGELDLAALFGENSPLLKALRAQSQKVTDAADRIGSDSDDAIDMDEDEEFSPMQIAESGSADPEMIPYAEKPLVLPKKKVTVSIKRPESAENLTYIIPANSMGEEEEGVTIGGIDSGNMHDSVVNLDEQK